MIGVAAVYLGTAFLVITLASVDLTEAVFDNVPAVFTDRLLSRFHFLDTTNATSSSGAHYGTVPLQALLTGSPLPSA